MVTYGRPIVFAAVVVDRVHLVRIGDAVELDAAVRDVCDLQHRLATDRLLHVEVPVRGVRRGKIFRGLEDEALIVDVAAEAGRVREQAGSRIRIRGGGPGDGRRVRRDLQERGDGAAARRVTPGTLVALRFKPPPLYMNVRIEGAS